MARPRVTGAAAFVAVLIACSIGVGGEPARKHSDLVISAFEVGKNGEPLVVKVTLDREEHPLSMLVDSGCSVSVYDKRFQSKLGARLGTKPVDTPRGQRKTVEKYYAPIANLGGIPLPRGGLVALTDLTFIESTSEPVDGILGMDFLREQIVEIDFDEGSLWLLRGVPEDAGERIEIRYNSNGIPLVEMKLGCLAKQSFKLDTGLFANNIATEDTFKWLKLFDELRRVRPYCSDGVHLGSGERGCVSQTLLGTFKHRDLRVETGPNNVLGLPYLSRFKLVFDFPGSAVYLKPGKRLNDPDCDDMSGMWISRRDGSYLVTRVGRGTPAEKAGVQINDVILSVNGCNANRLSILQLRGMFEEEGKSVILTVRRASVDTEFGFKLQDYFDESLRQVPPLKQDVSTPRRNRNPNSGKDTD